MIYGFRLLFLSIFSLMWKWILCSLYFLYCSSSGFSGAVERNVYTSWNEITHEKFVVGVFLSIAFVVVMLPNILLPSLFSLCVIWVFVGVHFVGGFGVFLSKWYMSSVVHCQFFWACLWFFVFHFVPFSFVSACVYVCMCEEMRVWKFLVRVITNTHISTLQRKSTNERQI